MHPTLVIVLTWVQWWVHIIIHGLVFISIKSRAIGNFTVNVMIFQDVARSKLTKYYIFIKFHLDIFLILTIKLLFDLKFWAYLMLIKINVLIKFDS